MSDLMDAIEALNMRKFNANELARDQLVELDNLRPMFIGTDLDVEEISEIAIASATHLLEVTIHDDEDFIASVSGHWIDGVLTGILLSELRSRRDT